MTEERRARQDEENRKYREAVAAQFMAKMKAVAAVATTEPGKILLRMLHDICGYSVDDRIFRADGTVNLEATALNSERRSVYLQIRVLVPPEILREIEIPLIAKTEEKK